MKKIIKCILGIFVLLWLSSLSAEENNSESNSDPEIISLRLHEAIAYALKDNITVQNTWLSRISDKFSLRVAEDQFAPQYFLNSGASTGSFFDKDNNQRDQLHNASASTGISLQNPYGGQLALTAAHQASFPEEGENNHSSGVNLRYIQPLLRGGGYSIGRAALTQAEFSERNSVLGLKSSLISTVNQVISSYRNYVLALRSLKISRLSLQRSEQQVDINKELIHAGRLAQVELIQSKTDLANQKLSLRSSENQVDRARLSLLRLLRLKQSVKLNPVEPLEIAEAKLDLEDLLETAFNNRPDYLQSLIALESAELQFELAQDSQRWDLNMSASYNLAGNNVNASDSIRELGDVDQGDFLLRLDLSVPIGEMSRKQTLVNARIQRMQARNRHIDLKEAIRLELVDTIRNIAILWEQVYLSERSLDLTRTQLELEQEKLRTGRSSNFQVVSFQNQLANAENQYVSTQITYLNALTDLDQKLGTTLTHWGIKMEPESGLNIDDIDNYNSSNVISR